MNREIKIIKSKRKTISLQVKNGEVILKAPFFTPKIFLNNFIKKHQDWIDKKLISSKKIIISTEDKEILKNKAKNIIPDRVEHFANIFSLEYNKIKITSAETRWGSCTSKKNLNFSYRLAGTPDFVIDYVVCHELSHLLHMNHSKSFWNQVEKMYPSYKESEKWLKTNGNNLQID